jgi:hypothetical protein
MMIQTPQKARDEKRNGCRIFKTVKITGLCTILVHRLIPDITVYNFSARDFVLSFEKYARAKQLKMLPNSRQKKRITPESLSTNRGVE